MKLFSMFIAIYGINNIGKSTQVKRIKTELEKIWKKVKIVKYPIYDLEPTGPKINYFLRDPEAPKISGESLQMLYIQNRLDYEPQLRKDLKTYDIVLAEDYTGTGMAWGMSQGVPYSWLQAKNMQYKQLPADLEILLDGERFVAGKEENHRNEADDEAMEKTRQNFLFLANKFKWPLVNANQSEEFVTKDILKVIQPFL